MIIIRASLLAACAFALGRSSVCAVPPSARGGENIKHLTPFKTLPWRIAAVVAAALAAFIVKKSWSHGGEVAFVVPALCLAGISLLLAWRLVLFVANSLVGLALFIPTGRARKPHWLVLETNRQLGHFEAIFSWLTLALVVSRELVTEVTLVAALFALGPLIINAVAIYAGPRRPRSDAQLHLMRRKYFYLATALGLLLLSLLDREQAATLLPLDVAILSGVVIRAIYFGIRAKLDDAPDVPEKWLYLDRVFAALALAGALAFPYLEIAHGEKAHGQDAANRLADPDHKSCTQEDAGFQPEASLFVVSDNQFHVLDGQRNGLQLPLIDKVVPVAARPVELDLLSETTLDHLADIFHQLQKTRPKMLWAHLGDVADVGCQEELRRFDGVISRFGNDSLAALAPGNHDSTFLGCFDWHPEWKASCSQQRTSPELEHAFVSARDPAAGHTSNDASFTARVTTLGTLGNGANITGIFLDSSDYGAISVGIAGSQGAISSTQIEWVLHNLPEDKGPVVIFMHHTYAELSMVATLQFERLMKKVDTRLLALITAHEHLAANRKTQIGGRSVNELVIGSTIDPPQEATLLDFRTGPFGPQLRVQSIPAIPSAALACPGQDLNGITPTLEECVQKLETLPPPCQPLIAPPPKAPQSPEELSDAQNARAKNVLACLGAGTGQDRPLDDPAVFRTVAGAADQTLALCLSSAASLVQGHKSDGWDLPRAIQAMKQRSELMGNRSIVVPFPVLTATSK
jgi:hypothetical protein